MRTSFVLSILFAALVVLSASDFAPASEATSIPKTRLVAIGVDKYPNESGLRPLNGCVADVEAFRETFDYAESTVAIDEQATRDAILAELNGAADDEDCERLVVFFACRGVAVRGSEFLCPVDVSVGETELAESSGLGDEEKSAETAKNLRLISLVEVLDVLKNAAAREIVVILDVRPLDDGDGANADESGVDARKLAEAITFLRWRFVVLTGSLSGDRALEIDVDGETRGAFSYFFLEGLRTGRADYSILADGWLTLAEAYNYARSETASYARARGVEQKPEAYALGANYLLNRIVLKTSDDDATPPENESDLQFLKRAGKILSRVRFARECNELGERTLNCVLENNPNDVDARRARVAVRRKLGDYAGALDDCDKIGQKFQLYAQDAESERNAPASKILSTSDDDENKNEELELKELDLLTITKIDGDRYFVSEVNNDASKSGWIAAKNAGWSLKLFNGANVLTATTDREATETRSVPQFRSSGLNPGTGRIGSRDGLEWSKAEPLGF